MNGHNAETRGLNDIIPEPPPAKPPLDMRFQPQQTGNEGLSDDEVRKKRAEQQVEQSDTSPIIGETRTLTDNSIVFPDTKT
jgi:hypothetical protein